MKFKFFTVILILILNSCLEDVIPPPFTGELEGAAEVLRYVESKGDYINTIEAPALIEAEDVYSNLNNYIIIDVRPHSDFLQGHIENSVNVPENRILSFVDSVYDDGIKKIIFVSKNGQSSAYYVSLLKLIGYKNIFSMNFGLAVWNEFFAGEWLSVLGNDPNILTFTKDNVPKPDLNNLPDINFENTGQSIDLRIKNRVNQILSEGFKINLNYRERLILNEDDFIMCYGKPRLYYPRNEGPYSDNGHPPTAVYYQSEQIYDLRSTKYLQTLPSARPILIYDGNGQLSAAVTAYLRLLGYNAISILFGGNQLFYSRLQDDPELSEYRFSAYLIRNYPYVSGE